MKRRWIVAGVVALAAAAAALLIFGGGGDSAPKPAPKPSSTATPTPSAAAVPDTVHPQVFGCSSITVAMEGTYTKPGCYYVPVGSTAHSESDECEVSFGVDGGRLVRIHSCATPDFDCTMLEEFGGKTRPQQGPDGFYFLAEREGCYYVASHLTVVVEAPGCWVAESLEAPHPLRRFDVTCS